jgi:plastocyanin
MRKKLPHFLTSPPPGSGIVGIDFKSELIPQGATFNHTFTKPGGFHYYDPAFPNMVGTVIVVE